MVLSWGPTDDWAFLFAKYGKYLLSDRSFSGPQDVSIDHDLHRPLSRGPTDDCALLREMCRIFGPGWLTLGTAVREYRP
jgi:hypothetical protein